MLLLLLGFAYAVILSQADTSLGEHVQAAAVGALTMSLAVTNLLVIKRGRGRRLDFAAGITASAACLVLWLYVGAFVWSWTWNMYFTQPEVVYLAAGLLSGTLATRRAKIEKAPVF